MISARIFLFIMISLEVLPQGQTDDLRAIISEKPIYLDNYIPASMHVIFHLTDLMKYDIRPNAPESTTTTIRPTPPHKPGNYAPELPLGPAVYFSKISARDSWTPSSQNSPGRRIPGVPGEGLYQGGNYKLIYGSLHRSVLPEDIDLLGAAPSDLLHQINSLGDFDTIGDDEDIDADDQILKFSINYEDQINLDFLRKKRIPPTRAYVTLLSLYDFLNKEAKEKGLNKYHGYTDRILKELAVTSKGSSGDQLKFVLSKILEKKNTRNANLVAKIKTLVAELNQPDSYISEALSYTPPLIFSF